MIRKKFISVLVFFGFLLGASCAFSSSPFEFVNMAQQQLDDAYDQSKWAPNYKETIAGYRASTDLAKKAIPPVTRKYGAAPIESMDVYAPKVGNNLPIFVFIHGGAWKLLSKDDAGGPAVSFVKAGAIYVALDFDVIPNATLPVMVEQIRRALLWVYENAELIGGDRSRIYVGGHSSGGHLAAVMLTTKWTEFGVPDGLIKGGVVVSGMGDLEPVVKSSRGAYLKLNDDEVRVLSPIKNMANARASVLVAWGGDESPEFIRQSRQLAWGFKESGYLYAEYQADGVDHFSMANLLEDSGSNLSKMIFRMMGLGAKY